MTWLGADGDEPVELGGADHTRELLELAKEAARVAGAPLDGWDRPPVVLRGNESLRAAVAKSWPALGD